MYQNVEINWEVFRVNFAADPRSAFERLSFLLFCSEFNQPHGIFQYSNQPYIETSPIQDGGDCVGFQAKYYDPQVTIRARTGELKETITNAKRKYPGINRLVFYLNKEFTASSTGAKEKPEYQLDVENVGKSQRVAVEWRVPSNFQAVLFQSGMEAVRDYFFCPTGDGIRGFMSQISEHSETVFENLHSDIPLRNGSIRIRRKDLNLESFLQSDAQYLLVHGESGTGKSGLIKDRFQGETTFQVLLFRATDFDVQTVSAFSRSFGGCTFEDFLAAFDSCPSPKVCILDSAEKIFTMNNQETFSDICSLFIKHGWKIVVTIRTAYKNLFANRVLQRTKYQEYELGKIAADELSTLESNYGLALPRNPKLRSLLCSLFYLKLYIASMTDDASLDEGVSGFLTRIWSERIQNAIQGNNDLCVRRETAICAIVLSNAEEGTSYYRPRPNDDSEAVHALVADDILGFDETMNGYYVTHDVYEELVLSRIMRTEFNRRQSCQGFFSRIGDSLVVRKAFRLWLHDVLEDQVEELSRFIPEALDSPDIDPMWKDDMLIALMNESDEQILSILSGPLGFDNYALFFRAVFLMNTSCKVVNHEFLEQVYTPHELESYNVYRYTRPEGNCWGFMFRYANDHKASINWDPGAIGLMTESLHSWAVNCHEGPTTKAAGQVALYLYNLIETQDHLRYELNEAKRKKVISAVLNSAQEILPELTAIIGNVASEDHLDHRTRHYDLCEQLLTDLGDSMPMCKAAPDQVILLAKRFWLEQDKTCDPMDYDSGVSTDFGLNQHTVDFKYFPSSAFQTPTLSLLLQSPDKALDFVVDLLDVTTTHYAASSLNTRYNECSEMVVHLPDGETIRQIASTRLWQMYRGTSAAPYLLQSVLMALERWLNILIQTASKEISVGVCLKLLRSHSAAITAVVVSSVVAYPDKLFEIARILLHSKEILLYDISRWVSETGANFGHSLIPKNEQFDTERLSSNALPFRNKRFEDIIVEYQMNRGILTDEQFTERKDLLYSDLDSSFAGLDSLAPELRFAYYRMDLRKNAMSVEPRVESDGAVRISLVPAIPDDLAKMQKEAEESTTKAQKLVPLILWCHARYEGRRADYEKSACYENNPQVALKESLEVASEDPAQFTLLQLSIPIYVSAILLRDFPTKITADETQTCTAILTRHLWGFVQQRGTRQVLDDTDVAIALLPELISGYQCTDTFSLEDPAILMLALLLGHGDSRELAVEAFRKSVFNSIPDASCRIIGAFVMLKPEYDKEVSPRNGVSPVAFLQEHKEQLESVFAQRTRFENLPYEGLPYGALETLSMLVRPGCDSATGDLAIGLGSPIWPRVFTDEMHGEKRSEYRDYEQEQHYISWLAEYLLCSQLETQHVVAQKLTPFLRDSRNTESLLRKIIECEDRLQCYESFWRLWDDELFGAVEGLCASQRASLRENEYRGEYDGGTLGEIVTTFSLAFPLWNEKITSWHTLRAENWSFFVKLAARLGYHPCVLYSIARVLNTIGFEFLDQGIDALATIIEGNPDLVRMPLQINTEYYLDEYMQRFIRAHRSDMKRNAEMRRKVIDVLNFLVNKGSTCGFMLREDI